MDLPKEEQRVEAVFLEAHTCFSEGVAALHEELPIELAVGTARKAQIDLFKDCLLHLERLLVGADLVLLKYVYPFELKAAR